MLASLAGLAQASVAAEIERGYDSATVTREIYGGLETITVSLPAGWTTDLRLNEPRYASLPNIMKAKKKQLDVYTPADLGVDVTSRVKTLKVEPPAERTAVIKDPSVDELVAQLRHAATVFS